MKKLLLAAAMLLTLSFTSKAAAPVTLNNFTNCDIVITQYCYDAACNIITSQSFTLVPGQQIQTNPCTFGTRAVYEVCWDNPCAGTCTTVEGSPGMSGCGPGAHFNFLPPCIPCSPGGATVKFDPSTNTLWVL